MAKKKAAGPTTGKKAKGPGKKAEKKKQEKVIEDKTFGLKNKKKSKQVQKYIQHVKSSVSAAAQQRAKKTGASGGSNPKQEKKAKEEQARQLALLLRQAPPKKNNKKEGADAKSAATGGSEATGTSASSQPQRSGNRRKKVFDKVEVQEPGRRARRRARDNGADRTWKDDDEDLSDALTLEEQIEEERAQLPAEGLTPVTKETFEKWFRERQQQWRDKIDTKIKKNEKKQAGSKYAGLTGKEIFTADSSLFVDDEGAAGGNDYDERGNDDSGRAAAAADSSAPDGSGNAAAAEDLAQKVDKNLYLEEDDDLSDISDD